MWGFFYSFFEGFCFLLFVFFFFCFFFFLGGGDGLVGVRWGFRTVFFGVFLFGLP